MDKREKASLQAYYAEAGSWAREQQDALVRSRQRAWIAAAAAAFVAVVQAAALIVLLPLKTIVPYTLLVDRQTGFVQALKPVDPQLVSNEAALTQSFLVQYVIAREAYDFAVVQNDYRKVALWSAGSARESYIAWMQPTNPESPIVRLGKSGSMEVTVKSVTALGRNVAMVRYDRQGRDGGGQATAPQPFVAVIEYSWSGAPMSVGDRFINPLGFKVVRYRTSMEALPATESPGPSSNRAAVASPPAMKVLHP